MKGIILAGGLGTRLYPITLALSKQILPVYNKPMVYYPLSTLMLSGIREVLIISTPRDMTLFQQLLGDGSELGCRFEYKIQEHPRGLADAFLVGKDFIGDDKISLILGDNIFYRHGLAKMLQSCSDPDGGIIFAYRVKDPKRYGIVEFDEEGKVLSIEEKPEHTRSYYAIPGLYFYDNEVISIAENIEPSPRGELEITDVNKVYWQKSKLYVKDLGRGAAWLDTGTFSSFMQASNFIQAVEERQNVQIGCIEEVAYRMNYIDEKQLAKLAQKTIKSEYGQYLKNILG